MNDAPSVCPTVQDRLAALEAKGRKFKWLTMGLALATILLAGESLRASGGRAKKIEAEQFVVKDKEGRVRARLGATESGLPELVLLDAKGELQAALHVYCDDAAALVFNEHGGTRIHMESNGEGASSLRFFDRSGKGQSAFFMWPDGTSGMTMSNEQASVALGVKPNQEPAVVVTDSGGREQGRLGSSGLDPAMLGVRPSRHLQAMDGATVANPVNLGITPSIEFGARVPVASPRPVTTAPSAIEASFVPTAAVEGKSGA